MYKKLTFLSLFAVSSLFANSELAVLKVQLKEQQKTTELLLQKVNNLEKKNTQNEKAQIDAQMAQSSSSSFSQNAYLPDIALILNSSAVSRNVNNSDYKNFVFPGFTNVGDAELPFNQDRGFNLNYAEMAIHSMVDPYFEAFAIFHLSPNAFEIEEAYVNTTSLPAGLRLKMGKFKSAFGRINEKHQHSWHFDEQPIIYKALFGADAISDPGIQLQWVAPSDTYIMGGIEAMQGSNDRSFGDIEKNNLYIAYLKSSVDMSDDLSLLGGLSVAHGKTDLNKDSNVYGIDLTIRQQLDSYSALSWQSEYLQRNKDNALGVNEQQGGLYTELIYQYNKNYSGGIRYETITKNDNLGAYTGIDTDNLDRYTVMGEYKPFDFSRIRLEYSRDRTKLINNERKTINTLLLSLNIAIGAHSAHAY